MPEVKHRPTRDQSRALLAYGAVSAEGYRSIPALGQDGFRAYKILVNDLGARILRSGLSATLSTIANERSTGSIHLLAVLASGDLPGLGRETPDSLVDRIRILDVARYMLVTREVLALAVWLRRAVQARDSQVPARRGGGDAPRD